MKKLICFFRGHKPERFPRGLIAGPAALWCERCGRLLKEWDKVAPKK